MHLVWHGSCISDASTGGGLPPRTTLDVCILLDGLFYHFSKNFLQGIFGGVIIEVLDIRFLLPNANTFVLISTTERSEE